MAWMLWEELCKAATLYVAALLVARVRELFMADVGKCFIKVCVRPAAMRGLCLVCYGKAKKKVESGETTWEQLEHLGLCKQESNPFDDAYNRAMEDN